MKKEKFTVVFTTFCFEEAMAFSKNQAIILAQAEQIKKGNKYNVDFVKDEDGKVI